MRQRTPAFRRRDGRGRGLFISAPRRPTGRAGWWPPAGPRTRRRWALRPFLQRGRQRQRLDDAGWIYGLRQDAETVRTSRSSTPAKAPRRERHVRDRRLRRTDRTARRHSAEARLVRAVDPDSMVLTRLPFVVEDAFAKSADLRDEPVPGLCGHQRRADRGKRSGDGAFSGPNPTASTRRPRARSCRAGPEATTRHPSFSSQGVRGPLRRGRVDHVPFHHFDVRHGQCVRLPHGGPQRRATLRSGRFSSAARRST